MVSSYALDDGAPNSLVSPPLLRAPSAECSRPRVDEGRAGGFSVRGVRKSAPGPPSVSVRRCLALLRLWRGDEGLCP